jgi:hypothetical protein
MINYPRVRDNEADRRGERQIGSKLKTEHRRFVFGKGGDKKRGTIWSRGLGNGRRVEERAVRETLPFQSDPPRTAVPRPALLKER